MRLDDAGPRTWLLGAVAAWALGAWILALAGMGGRITPMDDDPALVQPLAAPGAAAPGRLGPPSDYARISARPLLSPDRRPQPFSLEPESEAARPQETFDYLLTGVLMTPSLRMAIIQPAGGGEPERLEVGEAPEAAPSWRLVALSARAAVFEGPEGEQSLPLRSYDGSADVRAGMPRPPAPRRVPAPPEAGGMEEGNAPPVDAVEDPGKAAPPATSAQEQMEAIRKRIEARREQIRREAQGTQPPQQR